MFSSVRRSGPFAILLLLVAALVAGCAPRTATETVAGDAETATPAGAVAADGDDTVARPADAAEELTRAVRQEALDAEARLVAAREADLRAREAEVARRELEERERRLREREQAVAERETRLRAERAEQERAQQAAAEATRLEAERAAQREAEARAAADAERAAEQASAERVAAAENAGGAADRAAGEGWTGDEGWRRGSRGEADDENAAAEAAAAPELLRAGMRFDVEIEESLSSGTSRVGDTFRSVLVEDVRTGDGTLVAPKGSAVWGEVVEARPLRRVGGQAALGLSLDRLVLPTGETVEIRAALQELGKNKKGDKAKIAGAVIAGAILGSILGDSEGALAGAAAGAAASTAYVIRSEGREVDLPAGTVVTLEIEEVVTVQTEYREPRRR